MKLINAGIATQEELMRRLEAGEDLRTGDSVLSYNKHAVITGNSPYRRKFSFEAVEHPIQRILWNNLDKIKKPQTWIDYVIAGGEVYCILTHGGLHKGCDYVVKINTDSASVTYLTKNNGWVSEAEPVLASKCWDFEGV